MAETDAEQRNTGAGGATGNEAGPTTGAGGTTGSEETGAGFDQPAAEGGAPGDRGREEDTGAGFDQPAAPGGRDSGGGGELY